MAKRKKTPVVVDELEIVCVSGAADGVRVALDPTEEVRLGRSRRGVELTDDMVSLHHATISWGHSGYVLRDLNSATGTRVGSVDLRDDEILLRVGDQFTIGSSVFEVRELYVFWRQAAKYAGMGSLTLVSIGLLGFLIAPRADRALVLSWTETIHQGSLVSKQLHLDPSFLRMRGINPRDLSIRRVEDADGDGVSEVWLRYADLEQVVTFDREGNWLDRGVVPMGCLDDGELGGELPGLSCRGVTWSVIDDQYAAIGQEGVVVWGTSPDEARAEEHLWRVNLRKQKTLAGFLAAAGIDRPAHYVICEGALPGIAAQVVLEDGRVAPLNRSCREAVKVAGMELEAIHALAFTATGHQALLDDLETFYSGNVDGVFRPPSANTTLNDWSTSPGTVIATAFVSFDETEHFFRPIAREGEIAARRIWLLNDAAPAPVSTTATLMRSGVVRLDPPGCALLEVEVSEWTCPLVQGCLPGSTFITVRDQGCGAETTLASVGYVSGVAHAEVGDLEVRVSTRVVGGLQRRDVVQARVSWRPLPD